ncbi:MAG: hypothetical protein IJU76_14235 [Desulfovibrionaceae bacterium]|nr:hypothetical protein [Desulfovibrionaceae bacterium]
MNQSSLDTLSTPGLRQSVRFGERYVSAALNRKLAGVLSAGVYHGFVVKPGGVGRVLIGHEANYPFSVAVVERNGFNLTVILDDPVYVEIPASGTWYIVIEAYYVESQIGYQRIVARETVESHHIVLAKIVCDDLTQEISENEIDTSVCTFSDVRSQADQLGELYALFVDQSGLFARLSDKVFNFEMKMRDQADLLGDVYALFVDQSGLFTKLSDRVFNLELKHGDEGGAIPSPEGYPLGDALITPVSIIQKGETPPENAALVLESERLDG